MSIFGRKDGDDYRPRAQSIDQAVSEARAVVQANPHDAAAHKNLASALETLGDMDRAIAEFREVLRLSPEDAQTRSHLGWMLSGRQNNAGAGNLPRSVERKSSQLAPGNRRRKLKVTNLASKKR